MENIVAARRLRKSMLKNMDVKPTFSALDDICSFNNHNDHHTYDDYINLDDKDKVQKKMSKVQTYKTKIIIKVFVSVVIVFASLVSKLIFAESLKSNKYMQILINQYKQDYSKVQVLDKMEAITQKVYSTTKYIIPEALANNVKDKYILNIKPILVSFDLKNTAITVMKPADKLQPKVQEEVKPEAVEPNSSIIIDSKIEGKGGGEPIKNELINTDSSAISIMQDDVLKIINKNINIKKPVQGTITSKYGVREQIFDDVNPYHTGLDIANILNTQIFSATEGIAVNVVDNDKYYGNYVEIETNDVIFKYAHLNKINIKVNEVVNHNTIIGLMGSTGKSTGSHLHWEIKINSKTVDPQQIINFY